MEKEFSRETQVRRDRFGPLARSASRHAACVSLPISYDVKQLETEASGALAKPAGPARKWRLIQPRFSSSTPFFALFCSPWINQRACRVLSEQNPQTEMLGPKIQAFRGTAHIAAVRGKGQALFYKQATIWGSSPRPPQAPDQRRPRCSRVFAGPQPLKCGNPQVQCVFLRPLSTGRTDTTSWRSLRPRFQRFSTSPGRRSRSHRPAAHC